MAAKLDIIIPVAGVGRRLRSYGPKCLFEVGGEPLLLRQVRLLAQSYPNSRIVVVAGFQAEKVKRKCPAGVKVVVNEDYENTNAAVSVGVGIGATRPTASVLVVYGDIIFDDRFAVDVDPSQSAALVCGRAARNLDLGVVVCNGQAVNFAYGVPDVWAKAFVLTPDAKRAFREISFEARRAKNVPHEILNSLLELGFPFSATPTSGLLSEIDSAKDIPALAGAG